MNGITKELKFWGRFYMGSKRFPCEQQGAKMQHKFSIFLYTFHPKTIFYCRMFMWYGRLTYIC